MVKIRAGTAALLIGLAAATQAIEATQFPALAGQRHLARDWETDEAAFSLIEKSEGLRLQSYSGGSVWLIGYGHSTNVTKGMFITEKQAVAYLHSDVKVCENALGKMVLVPITQNEFSALVSLCYSTGWYSLRKSTVIARLNAGDHAGAANAFMLWVKAGGKQVPHLVVRRTAERELFLR